MQIQLDKFSVESVCLVKILKEADRLKIINCEWDHWFGCQDRETLICKIDRLWFIFGYYGENSDKFKIAIYNRNRDIVFIVFDYRGWLYTDKELKHKKDILFFINRLFNDPRFSMIREPLMNVLCANNVRRDFPYYDDNNPKIYDDHTPPRKWNKNREDTLKILNGYRLRV